MTDWLTTRTLKTHQTKLYLWIKGWRRLCKLEKDAHGWRRSDEVELKLLHLLRGQLALLYFSTWLIILDSLRWILSWTNIRPSLQWCVELRKARTRVQWTWGPRGKVKDCSRGLCGLWVWFGFVIAPNSLITCLLSLSLSLSLFLSRSHGVTNRVVKVDLIQTSLSLPTTKSLSFCTCLWRRHIWK